MVLTSAENLLGWDAELLLLNRVQLLRTKLVVDMDIPYLLVLLLGP